MTSRTKIVKTGLSGSRILNFYVLYPVELMCGCYYPGGTFYNQNESVYQETFTDHSTGTNHWAVWSESVGGRDTDCVQSAMVKIIPDLIRKTGDNGAKTLVGFSDNCAGQNKSQNTVMFLSILLNSFESLQRIALHFIPKGNHRFSPDSAHAKARIHAKGKTHECPAAIFAQIAAASKTFKVYEMSENSDFVTVKHLTEKFIDLTTKSKRNTVDGHVIKFTEITVLCLERLNHPREIGIKYTLYPDEPFLWYPLLKNNRDFTEFFNIKLSSLPLKYDSPNGKLLPVKKKKDLVESYRLCQSREAKLHLNFLLANKKFGNVEDDPDNPDYEIHEVRLHTEEELAAINESELESLTTRDSLLKKFDQYCPRE